MNFGNEDYNTFGGIPSSIIAYSGDRARYQTYDGIYDIQTNTNQQLTTLQSQISALQTKLTTMQSTTVSQSITSNPNLLANGDCSQFTLNQPIIGTCKAGANNEDFPIQGKCLPIFDRWYHVAELTGLSPSNFKMSCSQVNLKDEIPFGTPYEAAPRICTKGIYVSWSSTNGSNISFTPEHTKPLPAANKWGALLGIQHMVPDVTLTLDKSYSLGFWIKSSYAGSGFIRVMRQYNTTRDDTAQNYFTSKALQRVSIVSFTFTIGWNYIEHSFTTNSVLNGNAIGDTNGLVIQIGPFHYTWYNSTNYSVYGQIFGGSTGFGWVLSELQLRTDVKASKSNFPFNIREYENTREYICGTSLNRTCFGKASQEYMAYAPILVSGLNTWDHSYKIDYEAVVNFPNKMKAPPKLIIWNAKKSGGSPGLKAIAATYFNENVDDLKSQASGANKYSFNTFHNDAYNSIWLTGTNLIKLKSISTDIEGSTIFPVKAPFGNRIRYITENNFVFNYIETLSFNDTYKCFLINQGATMENSSTLAGRFVMIVPEADLGKPDPSANDWTDYIDYVFSAITTIPFP